MILQGLRLGIKLASLCSLQTRTTKGVAETIVTSPVFICGNADKWRVYSRQIKRLHWYIRDTHQIKEELYSAANYHCPWGYEEAQAFKS